MKESFSLVRSGGYQDYKLEKTMHRKLKTSPNGCKVGVCNFLESGMRLVWKQLSCPSPSGFRSKAPPLPLRQLFLHIGNGLNSFLPAALPSLKRLEVSIDRTVKNLKAKSQYAASPPSAV